MVISDNPAGSGVFNPAIAASPDGETLSVIFYDQRANPGSTTRCDLFLAQSFDGGNTWQPNLRLTSESTDAALAPRTADGFMLGDYLGIAAPTGAPGVPAVPVWIDTRTGNPDPFAVRVETHPAFFGGETLVADGVFFLTFPNGTPFGFYTYAFFPYLYHFDLGFLYFIDAQGRGARRVSLRFHERLVLLHQPQFSVSVSLRFRFERVSLLLSGQPESGALHPEPAFLFQFPDRPGHHSVEGADSVATAGEKRDAFLIARGAGSLARDSSL